VSDEESIRDAVPDGDTTSRDVNEAAEEEWIEETTPFERVSGIVRRTYEPQRAAEIAERARVSPTTARKHLRALVASGDVTTVDDEGATCYRRSETSIVTEHAEALLDERTPSELASDVARTKTDLRDLREEHGVESPEEFARALDVTDADTDRGEILTEWQTTRRNLALAEAALAIGEAAGHLEGDEDAPTFA